jgi:D-beta-D-heptose 7-phosphate kinase/D-beta-D-heptose 1-phosphate adenosyltransferase
MNFSQATILCFGDIMLDRFCYCESDRLSPEAPVPVLLLQRTQNMLGGAGNVARNIVALGGTAIIVGLVGPDGAGDEIRKLAAETNGIVDASVSSERRTTAKSRYIAGHQQIVRIDEEQPYELEEAEEAGLTGAFARALANANGVILSDYGKSVLNDRVIAFAISEARKAGIPVYVDPKREDYRQYYGATCITPNLNELSLAARMPVGTDDEVIAAARKVMGDAGAEAILATRSEKGMALVEASGTAYIEGARAREVFDVSGAGDTVIAVLALACASGYDRLQAVRLANTAAGIVVSKLGTATVELDELMLELTRNVGEEDWLGMKNYSVAEAETLVRRWKDRGFVVGFTNGCFDILHTGHIGLLAAARKHCDRLIVALNSDDSARRLKGPERPLNLLTDRSAILAALQSVDAVISFDEDTPFELIQRLQPDVLVKGGDYTIDTVVGADAVKASGGRVILVDLIERQSTTRLINTIRAPGVLVVRADRESDKPSKGA